MPPEFTASTGWPGCGDCGIVTSLDAVAEYPVKFTCTGVVAKSIGDCWPKFLRHAKIRKGKFIVFEPVDERCLVATVYPPANAPEFMKTLRVTHNSRLHSAKLVRFTCTQILSDSYILLVLYFTSAYLIYLNFSSFLFYTESLSLS